MKHLSGMTFKKGSIFSIISLILLIDFWPASAQNAPHALKRIVLDAGHGGKDIGTPHYLLTQDEKDIALNVILKLGQILKDSMPDLQVIYTRTSDVFIPLQQRHEIANKANADLFISVHVNSTAGTRTRVADGYHYVGRGRHRRRVRSYRTIVNRSTDAHGTETYVLGLHRNPQKSKAIENYSETVTDEPGMLDENDPTTQILVAQYTQTFLSKSIDFASLVQQNFEKQGRASYGVKQKGLEVLAGSAMPGVLIETGFINNPDDEKYLNSSVGQQQIAMAIYYAIKSYKAELARKEKITTAQR
ncbi:MAG TPA: N-acetylmuramoyl-L-alanine amidase [Edaphocola sp.]|nr:N-acetylmuramoyl-L-alanine amidase [Edaphocola sp.]